MDIKKETIKDLILMLAKDEKIIAREKRDQILRYFNREFLKENKFEKLTEYYLNVAQHVENEELLLDIVTNLYYETERKLDEAIKIFEVSLEKEEKKEQNNKEILAQIIEYIAAIEKNEEFEFKGKKGDAFKEMTEEMKDYKNNTILLIENLRMKYPNFEGFYFLLAKFYFLPYWEKGRFKYETNKAKEILEDGIKNCKNAEHLINYYFHSFKTLPDNLNKRIDEKYIKYYEENIVTNYKDITTKAYENINNLDDNVYNIFLLLNFRYNKEYELILKIKDLLIRRVLDTIVLIQSTDKNRFKNKLNGELQQHFTKRKLTNTINEICEHLKVKKIEDLKICDILLGQLIKNANYVFRDAAPYNYGLSFSNFIEYIEDAEILFPRDEVNSKKMEFFQCCTQLKGYNILDYFFYQYGDNEIIQNKFFNAFKHLKVVIFDFVTFGKLTTMTDDLIHFLEHPIVRLNEQQIDYYINYFISETKKKGYVKDIEQEISKTYNITAFYRNLRFVMYLLEGHYIKKQQKKNVSMINLVKGRLEIDYSTYNYFEKEFTKYYLLKAYNALIKVHNDKAKVYINQKKDGEVKELFIQIIELLIIMDEQRLVYEQANI